MVYYFEIEDKHSSSFILKPLANIQCKQLPSEVIVVNPCVGLFFDSLICYKTLVTKQHSENQETDQTSQR